MAGKEDGDDPPAWEDAPVELAVDGVLDLHAFSPKDIRHLIPDYLDLCHAAGILQVRIIHGKGIGNLRRTVQAILARHPLVERFATAGNEAGGWGATLVDLRPQSPENPEEHS